MIVRFIVGKPPLDQLIAETDMASVPRVGETVSTFGREREVQEVVWNLTERSVTVIIK